MCVEFHCCRLDCEVDKVLSVNVIDECAAIDSPPSSAIDCNIPHIHITIIYTYDIILTIEKKIVSVTNQQENLEIARTLPFSTK